MKENFPHYEDFTAWMVDPNEAQAELEAISELESEV